MSIPRRKILSVLAVFILCTVSFAKIPTVSVATLETLTRDDVTIRFVFEKFGKCNLQSIDGDREYRFFYQFFLEDNRREAFLKQHNLPDARIYSIEISFAAGSYVNAWIKVLPDLDRTKALPQFPEPLAIARLRTSTPNSAAEQKTP